MTHTREIKRTLQAIICVKQCFYKNVIDKLYSVSVMRHIVSIQDDYLVTFEIVGEENEKTAYAMCISGSMLPEDIKQQTDGAVLNDNSNFGAIPNSDSNA